MHLKKCLILNIEGIVSLTVFSHLRSGSSSSGCSIASDDHHFACHGLGVWSNSEARKNLGLSALLTAPTCEGPLVLQGMNKISSAELTPLLTMTLTWMHAIFGVLSKHSSRCQ